MLRTSKSYLPRVLLVLLLLFHLLANIWWLAADNHAIETDEEGHMISARDYYSALFPFEGPRDLRSRLVAVSRIEPGNPAHPPLLHILAAVAIRLLGYSTNVMAFTMTPLFLLALVGCYLTARLYLNDWDALFCVCVVSLTPMVYAASRYLMTDYLSMVIVVWAMYALLRSDQFMKMRWAALFGLLNGLGVLTRPTTFIYLLAPAALAVGIGLCRAIMDKELRSPRLCCVIRNGLLALMISVAVFGPWYAWQHERFFGFWFTYHEGGPMAMMRYEHEEAPALPSEPDRRIPAEGAGSEVSSWRLNLNPVIPWVRYPVLIINNGTFLITFLLALAGIAVLFCVGRFRRTWPLWQSLVWIVASYLLMTTLMRFANARYALQFIPPVAMFSVLPFLAIRHAGARRLAKGCYIALLLFQYGNLTFHDYGPLGSLKIPWMPDESMQRDYDDHGLYVFKPRLTLSIAYSRVSAPITDNFKERLFSAMARAESKHALWGEEAYFTTLNARGMALEKLHYWPESERATPFRYPGLAEQHGLWRRFRHYGWGRSVEEILQFLAVSHYVVYTTEDIDEAEEARWLHILEDHGFTLFERFYDARRGRIPGRYLGVLARPPAPETLNALTSSDANISGVFDLYRYRQTHAFAALAPEEQKRICGRLAALVEADAHLVPLNQSVSLVNASVAHDREDWYTWRFIFKVRQPITRNWRLYFYGEPVVEAHKDALPDTSRIEWNFNPAPDTVFWPDNDHVVVLHRIQAMPVPHALTLGFFTRLDGYRGGALDFGVVDFGSIPKRSDTLPPRWIDGPWDESQALYIHCISPRPRLNLPPELQALRRLASPTVRELARYLFERVRRTSVR